MKKQNKKAFTLAEIVIALAILGSIAALTIPTFFADSPYQKNQYVASLKKVYGELSYATDQIKAKNSGTMLGSFSDASNFTDSLRDLYLPYMKVTYTCDYGEADEKCWHADNVVKNLKGTIYSSNLHWTSKMILNDGTLVLFNSRGDDCNYSYFGVGNICGEIKVDVNGFKPPNQWGRDIHLFWLNRKGIEPMIYTNGIIMSCSLVNPADYIDGGGCAARILKEGKMLY